MLSKITSVVGKAVAKVVKIIGKVASVIGLSKRNAPAVLALPRELRDIIYQHVESGENFHCSLLDKQPPPALLQVCHQTRTEYLHHLRSIFPTTCFHIPLRFFGYPEGLPFAPYEPLAIDYHNDVYKVDFDDPIKLPPWVKTTSLDTCIRHLEFTLTERRETSWRAKLVVDYEDEGNWDIDFEMVDVELTSTAARLCGIRRLIIVAATLQEYFRVMVEAGESLEPSTAVMEGIIEMVASSQRDGRFELAPWYF